MTRQEYWEYYVQPPAGTFDYGGDRIVVGSDGSYYYTGDHYGSFAQIL